MEDPEIGLRLFQLRLFQQAGVVELLSRFESLFLDPGHVENIDLRDELIDRRVKGDFDALLFQLMGDGVGKRELFRSDEIEADRIVG